MWIVTGLPCGQRAWIVQFRPTPLPGIGISDYAAELAQVAIGTDARRRLGSDTGIYGCNDDSKEKRAIGGLREDQREGRCLFVMPTGPDWSTVEDKIKGDFNNEGARVE